MWSPTQTTITQAQVCPDNFSQKQASRAARPTSIPPVEDSKVHSSLIIHKLSGNQFNPIIFTTNCELLDYLHNQLWIIRNNVTLYIPRNHSTQ